MIFGGRGHIFNNHMSRLEYFFMKYRQYGFLDAKVFRGSTSANVISHLSTCLLLEYLFEKPSSGWVFLSFYVSEFLSANIMFRFSQSLRKPSPNYVNQSIPNLLHTVPISIPQFDSLNNHISVTSIFPVFAIFFSPFALSPLFLRPLPLPYNPTHKPKYIPKTTYSRNTSQA